MKPEDFIKEYLPYATKCEESFKVPRMVTLAQAALESAWGEHAPEYNFFGIKAGKGWTGKVQKFMTHEYVKGKRVSVLADFRAYDSPYESFRDHAELLQRRWPKAFEYSDPVQFVKSMQTEHLYAYATDPYYVDSITKVIHSIERRLQEAV